MKLALPQLGRPVWVLLSGILFTHLGTFMLMPFLAIILSSEKGLSLGRVGWVIGAGSIAYLLGSLIGGFISDVLGKKRTMVFGLILRGVGLVLFVWMMSFTGLFLVNLLTGIGDGLYMPPAKAGIATFSSQQTKTTAFSYRGIAANIGVTVGPVIGTFLMHRSSSALFVGAAVVYFGLAVAHWILLRGGGFAEETVDGKKQSASVRALFADKPFLVFGAVTVVVWALFTQMTLSLPLRAEQIHSARNIGLIWTSTSLLVVLLQGPITRFCSPRVHPLLMMAIGSVVMGIGLGSVAFSTSFWHLAGSAVLFTLGEMFVMPTSDAIVSDLARPEAIGAYFGVASFVFGAGESVGNIGGGNLMETAVRQHFLALPWMVYAVAGVAVGGLYVVLSFWAPLAKPLSNVLEERTDNATIGRRKQKT